MHDSVTLAAERCPKCKSVCWVNCGNLDDFTGVDPESGICWSCSEVFLFEDGSDQSYPEMTYSTAKEAL